MKVVKIPTGYLFSDVYHGHELETLSIGDYGKPKNVKADFLGYTKELNGVENGYCMPLTEKWVITISTERGCSQNCTFCSVPNIKYAGIVPFEDLFQQFVNARNLFPNIKYVERLNIHAARAGEPLFNPNVNKFARYLYENKRQIQNDLDLRIEVIHPVLTTSLPNRLNFLEDRLQDWCDIKNNLYNGQAGLQFSINSTNEEQRQQMFNGKSLTLKEFSKIADKLPEPLGRKYCLNFAYSTDFEIDGKVIGDLFDSNKFMCKITPIHNNQECRKNGIETIDGYTSYHPYKKPEESLKNAGFDVLVFVPSLDEENGAVTCGNLILGGDTVISSDVHKIEGV